MSEPYWEPLAAASVVPMPIQNGKWLKGEGGALVWTDTPLAIVNSGSAIHGPTGITTTGNGDALLTFPAATYEAVAHILNLFGYYQDNAGNSRFYFRLHDGTAPGPLVGSEIAMMTPPQNPGQPMNIQFYFVPTAGVHTYQLRWRGSGAGAGFQLGISGLGFTALIRKL
jgi:hypothetical protein